MKKEIAIILASFAAGLLCCYAAPAETFKLHKLFSPHMVLQREKPVRIFGTAAPGDSVKVTFAGKTKTAAADVSGDWLAEFPAVKAGTGYTIEVTGADPQKKVIMKDVAVGEVWLCSGQSNMQMAVMGGSPYWRAANAEVEVKNANWPEIREFHVTHVFSPGKEKNALSGKEWLVCNPRNVRGFTAFGYFFARQLYRDLKVPIGIIHAAYGGSRIMAWMPNEAFAPAGETRVLKDVEAAGKFLGGKPPQAVIQELDKKIVPWVKKFNNAAPEKTKAASEWKNPDFDDSGWQSWNPDKTRVEKKPQVTWYRNSFSSIPADYAKGNNSLLFIPSYIGTSQVYLNGKLVAETDVLKPLDRMWKSRPVRLKPGVVVPGKNVVAIRLSDYGTGATRFKDVNYTHLTKGRSGRTFDAKNWKMKTEYTVDTVKTGPCPPLYDSSIASRNFPGTLFNGMIAPLVKYPVRGVLWYQGEGDAYDTRGYYFRQKAMIDAWRKRLHNLEMPFILVQLAGYERHCPGKRLPDNFWQKLSPGGNYAWAVLRETQAAIGNLPDVGLITAIDVGDSSDVHPRDKQTLGLRAAKEAERLAYGRKIVSRGPAFRNMKIEGNKIRIFFDNIGGGLTTKDGKAPNAFAIAGKDDKFVWADAVIDGSSVVVSSPKVADPVKVRYAWITFRPDLNLCNKEGFPAFPFRTDAPEYK